MLMGPSAVAGSLARECEDTPVMHGRSGIPPWRRLARSFGRWPGWRVLHIGLMTLVAPGALIGTAAFLTDPAHTNLREWLDRRVSTMTEQPLGQDVLTMDGTEALSRVFVRRAFQLDAVREGWAPVPRIYLASLPSDLQALDPTEARKELFLRAALPLVLVVNEGVMADRGRLEALRHKREAGAALTEVESRWLRALARRYRAQPTDLGELLRRVDVIPPSLVLAQGAIETGWGTSRPAVEDNALFGEMRWVGDTPQDSDRPVVGGYIVRPFGHLFDCVRAYADNLNTHPAYADFRERRWEMRVLEERLDGYQLAITLDRYSERGWAYIADVRRVIRTNSLTQLDDAWLDGQSSALLIVPGT